MMKVQTSSLAAACVAMTILCACGDDNSAEKSTSAATEQSASDKQAAPAAQDSATTATPISAGQLEFFTERYISAGERLLRRQNRIEEELSGPASAGQS